MYLKNRLLYWASALLTPFILIPSSSRPILPTAWHVIVIAADFATTTLGFIDKTALIHLKPHHRYCQIKAISRTFVWIRMPRIFHRLWYGITTIFFLVCRVASWGTSPTPNAGVTCSCVIESRPCLITAGRFAWLSFWRFNICGRVWWSFPSQSPSSHRGLFYVQTDPLSSNGVQRSLTFVA